jgi:M6 family metalloprotease-like protein
MVRRFFYLFNIFAVLVLLVEGGFPKNGQAASPLLIEGNFLIVWGDATQSNDDPRVSYILSMEQSDPIQLIISDDIFAQVGGPIGFDRKPVTVEGMWQVAGRSVLVKTISLAEGEQAGIEGVYGSQPWVSILCKFKDYPNEPNNLQFFKNMYSNVYPGLDHFWRQNSYDLANLEGSDAFGWYVLPQNRDYYVSNNQLNLQRAAEDCTRVADAYVYFPDYVGINLMFNYTLDCCAWGGGWRLNLDGHNQVWRMTWEPPWGYQNIGVIAHETGHGFGLPHSLGNCRKGYDNRWDVLSDVWSNGSDPYWGTMGQHTISYHKELVEWIKPNQVFNATTGTINTITLEQLALPQTSNYLGARIPINGSSNHFYTLEVRQPAGNPINYDKWLPGFAVIIHDIDVSRQEPAIVIDQDGDCNTGDAGAMYTAGEVFTDAVNGITVTIDSVTETGYIVTINNRFTPMSDIELEGPAMGKALASIPFTVTVSPSDVSTPITYTWVATGLPTVKHTGDTVDRIAFIWQEIGTKAITVTADNNGSILVDTHYIEVESMIPIVSLSGPTSGKIGVENVFNASSVPIDVGQPITYTWQASGQSPITHTTGLTDTVSYIWNYPGTQVITVTAENIQGSTTDTISILVRMAPSGVEVSGAEAGGVDKSNQFTASVDPITATVPITYVWSVDGELAITHMGGITDSVMFSWEHPGVHVISVAASNPAGIVEDAWSFSVYIRVFMPLSLRQ